MHPPGSPPALTAEGVVKRFGPTVALDDVSLSIASGELLALVGESGSGKTTLLRMFNRMAVPDAGRVLSGDRDVATVDPVALRRATGYVQQDGGLVPHWSVLHNAGLVPWLRGRREAERLAREALDLVGLPAEAFGDRYPSRLSGGQRQRVAIARALADHPSVLLMDEPFGALDAITRADLQRAFAELRSRVGATVLLVTHDLREAFLLADRIAVMQAGRIDQVAAPRALRAAPATPYVRRLLETAEVA